MSMQARPSALQRSARCKQERTEGYDADHEDEVVVAAPVGLQQEEQHQHEDASMQEFDGIESQGPA